MPVTMRSLIRSLAESQRELEHQIRRSGRSDLWPVLTRRRRALAVLRGSLPPGDAVREWPCPATGTAAPGLGSLEEREQALLALYDAVLGEVPSDSRLHAILRQQRSETEQARWALMLLQSRHGALDRVAART